MSSSPQSGRPSERRHVQATGGAYLPDSQLQFVQNPEQYRAPAPAAAKAPSTTESARAGTPTAPTVRRDHLVRFMIVLIVLGAVMGLAWYLLTPRDAQAVWNGVEWLPADSGLWLQQDLVFAGLSAAIGLIVGLILVARASRPNPAGRLIAALLGSCAGVAAAVVVGLLLEPASTAAKTGAKAVAPLVLHAWGFALTWPLVAMAVCAVLLILRSFTSR